MLTTLYEKIKNCASISDETKTTITENQRFYTDDNSWMEGIFGFTDSPNYSTQPKNIKKLIKNLISYDEKSGILKVSKERYKAGWFICPTLEEVINTVVNIKKNQNKGCLKITVISNKDVADLHLECKSYEVIQLASQLNALEMINPNKTPDDGIEIYSNDRTQGPIAAMACAAGLFVRNYNMIQNSESQFNTLEKIDIQHKNGYLLWGNNPNNVLDRINIDNMLYIMIPCQIYTQVVGVSRKRDEVINHFNKKLVHQIYSSAAPINKYGNGGNIEQQIKINEYLLFSHYMGAILMAYILNFIDRTNTRASIQLTLVGTGAFGININIVLNIIKTVCICLSDLDIDIYIHGYTEYETKTIENLLGIDRYQLNIIKSNIPYNTFYNELHKKISRVMLNVSSLEVREEIGVFLLFPEHYPIIPSEFFYEAERKKIDISGYIVIYPNERNIKAYQLREHQENILKLILTNHETYYTIYTDDVLVDVDADNLAFRSETGIIGYFVNIGEHPKLSTRYDKLDGGEYRLYDLSGKKVTKWPLL
jgi:hypothetical protein